MSTNASRYDHQVLIHAAAITTPNDCSSGLATVTTLRALEIRRSSSRSGRARLARSLRRSVGRTSGSASRGRHHRALRRRSSPSASCAHVTLTIAVINSVRSPRARSSRTATRSAPARSCCRCSSGPTRRRCRWADCVDFTSLFGIAAGTMRTALSRMVDRRRTRERRRRATDSSGRLLERQAQQDTGRRPAPDDVGRHVVVRGRRRRPPRRVAERRAFRTRADGCGWASCDRTRGCVRRTSTSPPTSADVVITRGPLMSGDDAALVGRLWDLDVIDAPARVTRVGAALHVGRTGLDGRPGLGARRCLRPVGGVPTVPAHRARSSPTITRSEHGRASNSDRPTTTSS